MREVNSRLGSCRSSGMRLQPCTIRLASTFRHPRTLDALGWALYFHQRRYQEAECFIASARAARSNVKHLVEMRAEQPHEVSSVYAASALVEFDRDGLP